MGFVGRRFLPGVCGLSLTAFLAIAPTATAAAKGCAAEVLQEWHDGRISLRHAPACYRSALANLPEDMLVYSSAQDDLQRALQARLTALAATHTARKPSTNRRAPSRVLEGGVDTSKRAKAAGTRVALAGIPTSADNSLPIPVIAAGAAALLLVGLASASRIVRKLRS